MNYRKDLQLEKLIDDAIKRSTFKRLEELQEENDEIISFNCSKQMTNKLNRLILRELSKKEIRNAGLLLICIHKYGKHMTIEGEDGLAAMINEDLVQKMIPWFEKAKKIWANSEGRKNEALINFAEDFFDALLAIFNYNEKGRCQVLDMFLYRVGSVVTDDRVSVYIQEEAIKKMNMMLNQMSPEDKTKVLSSSEMQLLMNDFGKRILDAGDYNLQVAITESLCRMTSESRRQELANNWFHVEFVVDAFKRIKDSEFEMDCRRFLNQVNGMFGERTSVSTYPCLEVFLDNCELRMPFDNKLEDFWIDFNVGSRNISFYVITEEDENEPMWGTVCLPEDDMKSYSVEVKNEKKLLAIDMNIPVRIGNIEGKQIQIYFDLALDILSIAMKVYNSIKYKQSSMKDRISEVKTAIRVIFDGNSSQVLVAENQLPSPSCKETGKKSYCKAQTDNGLNQDIIHTTKIPKITMSSFLVKAGYSKTANQKPLVARNRKTSEVSVVVRNTAMSTRKSTYMSTAVNSTPARKTRIKPPLEMKNSSGRNSTFKVRSNEAEPGNSIYGDLPEERAAHMTAEEKTTVVQENAIGSKETTYPKKATSQSSKSLQKKITASKFVELLQEEDERNLTSQTDLQGSQNDIVPDSQPVALKQKSLLPSLLDNIHKDQKCLSKKRCWVSDSPASSCSTVERQTASVKYALQKDDRIIKHQAFCSIFDKKSPKEDEQNKFKNSKNEALEMQLEGKLEKVTPGGMHEGSGTSIKDNYKTVQNTANGTLNPSSTKVSATEKLCLHSVCQTKFTENMASEMDKFRLDEISCNIGSEKQNTPNSNKSSKSYKTDLMCRNQPKKRECDIKENTVTEKMISAIAAKYINETKEKHLNKEVPRSTRYRLDELHDKKLQKNLKDEKQTWKRQKGGVAGTVNLKNKIEDSALDVYSFDDSFTAEPTISLGMQDKKMPQQTSSNKRKFEKMNTKHKPMKKEEIHKSVGKVNRRHFFTDTETDGKTDISWLQQSNRKTKPELLAYSRQRKRNMVDNLGKGNITSTVRTDCGKKSKAKKNPTEKIKLKEVPAEKKQRNCPQRAVAMQKSYKEVSESASDSNGESLSLSGHRERDLIMQVPAKKVHTNAKEKAIMLADYEQQNEISEASTAVSYENTSAEKTKYEKACESEVLTRSSSLVESLPSIHTDSSPEPLQSPHSSMVVTNPCKFSRSALKTATPLSSPDFSAAKATFTSGFSATISPISLVTPLCPEINENSENAQQELVKLKNPDEDITNKSQSSENSFATTRSPNNFTLSSILSKKATAEKTPSRSTILEKNRRGEKDRIPLAEARTLGSTRHSFVLKRICGKNLQSDFSDVEEEEEPIEQRAKLKPRRLFSFDFGRPNTDQELLSTSNEGSSIKQMDYWGQSEPNMGLLCQQFSKELKAKFQRHSQRIDIFTKFSLKSLQQRMSSTNVQIHSWRLQRLNKFQAIVMQELQRFEKDCLSLKCMEKELSNFWKQRSEAFNELKENQEESIQHLRSSLENNVCHSMEVEEKIFSTEMHLMRKDMKAAQDRLLKEMQEEELLTVRRGLQSFFLSETTPF